MGRAHLSVLLAFLLALAVSGCAGRHFQDAGEPPAPQVRYTLDDLPSREYWTGILFNDSRIGFSHFAISPSKTRSGCFEIRCQAFMNFRFLAMQKKVSVTSFDLVDKDLRLISFVYDYFIDDSLLKLTGEVNGDILKVIGSSGKTGSENEFRTDGELYPGSATNLYPLVHGLSRGKKYTYRIYDGEAQKIVDISQEVLAYERSDLFQGGAYRISTRYLGQDVTTWLNGQGLPLIETALGGVIVTRLENQEQAREYLVQSSLNRKESLLDFSLVRVRKPIPNPGRVTDMEVYIDGVPEDLTLPSDGRQTCERRGERVLCSIRAGLPGSSGSGGDEQEARAYLQPSIPVPSDSPEVRSLALKIACGKTEGPGRVEAILAWIRDNIRREPVDVFSALDVLTGKRAECQGHAYLYAALARSLGIPTRVVNGVVYAEDFQGFLYHSWAESFLAGQWVAVDPTLCQFPADATHIKFLEGETVSSLAPLVGVMGRISIEVRHAR
jgi:hypothetical protein